MCHPCVPTTEGVRNSPYTNEGKNEFTFVSVRFFGIKRFGGHKESGDVKYGEHQLLLAGRSFHFTLFELEVHPNNLRVRNHR